MLIQDRIEKYWYMFCNRAGLLVTMHPLRRLAMSANIVMNIFFGCRGFYLVRSTIKTLLLLTILPILMRSFHGWEWVRDWIISIGLDV